MVKILGISGSPRKASTDYVVHEALKAAEEIPGIETEFWGVRGKKINFCTHCDRCIREKTLCYIDDDVKILIDKILEADGFIIGSPVYDMGITAQLTAIINRTRPFYMVRPGIMKNKVGGAITIGGTRHGGQETALQIINNWYLMSEVLSTGGLSGCYNGGTVWSQDKKAEGAKADVTGMDTVRGLGRGVAEAAMITSMGRKHWEVEKKRVGLITSDTIEGHDAFSS